MRLCSQHDPAATGCGAGACWEDVLQLQRNAGAVCDRNVWCQLQDLAPLERSRGRLHHTLTSVNIYRGPCRLTTIITCLALNVGSESPVEAECL